SGGGDSCRESPKDGGADHKRERREFGKKEKRGEREKEREKEKKSANQFFFHLCPEISALRSAVIHRRIELKFCRRVHNSRF
ncbi:hypothetical protein P3S44_26170, partial [Enterobacter hormaechei]|uniref:hypothetical protein n=1 Tax=Enterobacter hormaechei TaxID=158836 RepID=UPI0023E3AD75